MNKYKVVLCMIEPGDGLSKKKIFHMMDLLEEDSAGYIPLEFEGEFNCEAVGFVSATYYEEISYCWEKINECIEPVLNDWEKISNNGEYLLNDNVIIYMDDSSTED